MTDKTEAPELSGALGYDKYLASAQISEVNSEIDKLRNVAFRTNSEDDRRELLLFLLHGWSNGRLLAHDLVATRTPSPVCGPSAQFETILPQDQFDAFAKAVDGTHPPVCAEVKPGADISAGHWKCHCCGHSETSLKALCDKAHAAGRSEALEEARAIAQHEAGTWHSAYTDTVKFACNRVSDRIRAINKEAGE